MIQLGFVSAILPELTLEETLQFASEAGYDCVEVMCWPPGKADRRYAGVTHLDVTDVSHDLSIRLELACLDASVSISGLGYYPNPLSPDPDEASIAQAHLMRLLEAAAISEVRIVNTFIGRNPTLSIEENWPRMLEVWRPIVARAEELGVRIGIENCPMLFTRDEWPGGKNLAISPVVWRRLFADLDSRAIGLNLDPSHFVWQQMDYVAAIREFHDRIVHVHAKDARIDRHKLAEVGVLAEPLQYHTPKLPGLGDVDWGAFFSALSDTGYTGAVCVEVEDRAFEGSMRDRKTALRQSAQYLRQYIGTHDLV